MRSSSARWLVLSCAASLGCAGDPRIDLPEAVSRQPASDKADGKTRTAECDQAPDGTECGLEMHCIFNACVANACGDGFKAAREACDDGNDRDDDGCDERCQVEAPPGCGNGTVEPGEECDDQKASMRCTALCTLAFCGDGTLSPGEECDDGNSSDGDRCDSSCKKQEGNLPDAGVNGMDASTDADAGDGTIYIDAGPAAPTDGGATGVPDAGSVPMDAGAKEDAGPVGEIDAGERPPFGTAQTKPACELCRNDQCRNYQALDFDFVAACFEHADPLFVQQCVDAVECAYTHGCGYNASGMAQCFCGSADLSACQVAGAANGPCQAETYAAARTTKLAEVIANFGVVTLPIGVANYLLACDHELCSPACRP